jgi:hypothetical protein
LLHPLALAGSGGLSRNNGLSQLGALALRGGLGGATGTAKARAGGAWLSAGAAEKTSGCLRWLGRHGYRLRGALPLRLRRESPDQCDNPADERPTREEVQKKYARKVRPVPRQKRRQKVQEQRDQQENAVEVKKGEERQRTEPHKGTLPIAPSFITDYPG